MFIVYTINTEISCKQCQTHYLISYIFKIIIFHMNYLLLYLYLIENKLYNKNWIIFHNIVYIF